MGTVCSAISRIVVSQLLSWSWRIAVSRAADATAASTKLRSLLRRFPYWDEGHRLLAETALTEKDVATAYASTHCFRLAGCRTVSFRGLPSPRHSHRFESQWRHLLGRCFLASGDAEQALTHLRVARLSCPQSTAIAEDQVAALMALGQKEEAAQVLRTIPEEHLSTSAKVAADYLRNSNSYSGGKEHQTR